MSGILYFISENPFEGYTTSETFEMILHVDEKNKPSGGRIANLEVLERVGETVLYYSDIITKYIQILYKRGHL